MVHLRMHLLILDQLQLNQTTPMWVGGVYNVLDRRIDQEHFNTTLEGRRYNIGLNYNF